MFVWTHSTDIVAAGTLGALLIVAFAFAHFGPNTFEMNHNWSFPMQCIWVSALAVCILRIVTEPGSPFLYFQF